MTRRDRTTSIPLQAQALDALAFRLLSVVLLVLAVSSPLMAAPVPQDELVPADEESSLNAPPSEFNDDLPDELQGVDIIEHLDERLPLDLEFVNEQGEAVRLGDIIDGTRPAILQMGYYRCPMLCDLVLNQAMEGLLGVEDLSAGEDFDLISVSVNPEEGPDIAELKEKG